jgi:hypothetical protein
VSLGREPLSGGCEIRNQIFADKIDIKVFSFDVRSLSLGRFIGSDPDVFRPSLCLCYRLGRINKTLQRGLLQNQCHIVGAITAHCDAIREQGI